MQIKKYSPAMNFDKSMKKDLTENRYNLLYWNTKNIARWNMT